MFFNGLGFFIRFFHFFGGEFLHVFILRIKKSKETIRAQQNKGRLKIPKSGFQTTFLTLMAIKPHQPM
ncbi:hypothetical protein HMPREF2568_11480 [Neisseria sp. HMSC059F02]|nr:hypothetical protein HMPREF2568_11480 [Neisseria sp. HMSC059F02]